MMWRSSKVNILRDWTGIDKSQLTVVRKNSKIVNWPRPLYQG